MAQLVEAVVSHVSVVIRHLGYPGVFLFMAMEASCVPIPSEIVLVFAGFLAARGDFSLVGAMIAGLAGALTGATITYAASRCGGRPLVERWGRFVLLTPRRFDLVERWFSRYGTFAVVICRWVTGLRAIVSVPAGLARMPYWRFIGCTAVGSGLWVVLAVLVGYFVGEEWQKVVGLLETANRVVLAVLVVAAVVLFALLHLRRRRKEARGSAGKGTD